MYRKIVKVPALANFDSAVAEAARLTKVVLENSKRNYFVIEGEDPRVLDVLMLKNYEIIDDVQYDLDTAE